MSGRTSLQITSSIPPSLAVLADPPIRHIDGPAMDYFVIEMINTLRESAAVATARAKKIEQEMAEAGLIPPTAPAVPAKKESARDSVTSLASRSGKALAVDEEEEAVRVRLEAIGMHVGANFTERYVLCLVSLSHTDVASRLCRDRPLFSETLDAIKFICKDIWAACWDKQVDNLRTNHRVRLAGALRYVYLMASSREFMFYKITRSSLYPGYPRGKGVLKPSNAPNW